MKRHLAWLTLLIVATGAVAFKPWVVPAGYDSRTVFRMHVKAHSDRPEDQALKLAVRDAVLRYVNLELSEEISAQPGPAAVAEVLRRHRGALEEAGRQVLRRLEAPYDLEVAVGRFPFEARSYHGRDVPAGDYHAVRVVIGSGAGQNWWCIVFPAVCSVEPLVAPHVESVVTSDVEPLVAADLDQGWLLERAAELQGASPEVRWAVLEWLDSRYQLLLHSSPEHRAAPR